jgi:hypothetical protein
MARVKTGSVKDWRMQAKFWLAPPVMQIRSASAGTLYSCPSHLATSSLNGWKPASGPYWSAGT